MPKDDIIIVGFFKTAEDEGVQAFKDLGNFINSDYNGCMFKDFFTIFLEQLIFNVLFLKTNCLILFCKNLASPFSVIKS